MPKAREDYDDLARDKNDEAWEAIKELYLLKRTCNGARDIVQLHLGQPGVIQKPVAVGGFNIIYKLLLEDSSKQVIVRFPLKTQVQLPEEKTNYEAATIKYLSQHTAIPVPHLLGYGEHFKVGPYLVLECINHKGDMYDRMAPPGFDRQVSQVLWSDIPFQKLEAVYYEASKVLLQLSKPTFARIGSLLEHDDSFDVSGRPITQNMNSMLQFAHIPPEALPSPHRTYETDDEWYTASSDMLIAQLIFQHNDFVKSEDDCRNKYVARMLFRRLARQGCLSKFGFVEDEWSIQGKTSPVRLYAPSGRHSFRIWCDDYRPANILMDELDKIISVIDWEYAYVAPTQFTLDPPWWLLLEHPETWSGGLEDFVENYEKCLGIWLLAMKRAEEDLSDGGIPFRLSEYAEESWWTGRFWLNYIVRKNWAFDPVYWKFLDEKFFGKRTLEDDGLDYLPKHFWKTRIHLLTKEEQAAMEPFVQRKMEESKERILVDWEPEEVKRRLSALLFD